MGRQQARPAVQQDIWACGLTLDDFHVPSQPAAETAISAPVTVPQIEQVQQIQLEPPIGQVADTATSYQVVSEVLDLDQLDEAWARPEVPDEDAEFADRKVLWPDVDPEAYRPASADTARIEANIAAIKLAQELAATPRQVGADEMTTLLKFSGWGGVARVFVPGGSTPGPLAQYHDQLEQLVGPKEFAGMRASVTTGFFTPPMIAAAMWRLLRRLGFDGGRVLEPAAGPGHFVAAMPRPMARRSTVTAVEVDKVSASILEACFAPFGAQVHACGLEDAPLPTGFYDLVVGNVPFGDFRTNDTSRAPYANWSIHNWFIGRSLELVRPGGLVAVITSRHTLDSETDAHRQWIAANADLVTAIRLPKSAFEAHAKTEAVTDILVFKRKLTPEYGTQPGWMKVTAASQDLFAAGEPVQITEYNRANGHSYPVKGRLNSYFEANPANMVGRLRWESGQFGRSAVTVFDGDMEVLLERLDELIDRLPEGLYEPAYGEPTTDAGISVIRFTNYDQAMPGAFVVHSDRICISEGAELLDIDDLYSGTARKRLLGMLEVKKAATAVIEHQARSEDDGKLKLLQQTLNGVYDAYVAKFGPLSTTANSRVMRGDPHWPLMLALEIWDDETQTATKADIFRKRTVGIPEVPKKVGSVKDAMLVSLALFAKIDLADMAMRCGKSVREVTEELRSETLAFRDPALGAWVPADEYLSGNIRDKIAQAKAAGPAYEANVPALEAVLPADLGPADVEARLGAPWIPVDVITTFALDLIGSQDAKDVEVTFDASSATWSVTVPGSHRKDWVGNRAKQCMEWGTAERCALDLLEASLNQQPPTITYMSEGRTYVDRAKTLAAREKWQAIKDKFREWVYADDARRDRLLRIYNDRFNQIVTRQYDGSHLILPGMSGVLKPGKHQLNAIWRGIVSGNMLLAHRVGAGKTLTMAALSMELRRLGKARKVFHVVQPSTLEQYCAEFMRLYPQARVLMATKDDFSGDRRRAFAARIATGDWDAVVLTQATFERIAVSPEQQERFINNMLAEARTMLSLAQDGGARRSIKEIEKRMKDYEAKLERLAAAKKDNLSVVFFDELGCDWVMYDEAHAAKGLQRISKMPRIAGLPNGGSQRAFDLWVKTRLIMEARNGREEGVTMATATPLSNSIAEMHVMQLYLQPETLKRYGLYEFDAWAATFGESVTGMELAPDGSGFRVNTRFCSFCNVPELMNIFRMVADIQTRSMLKLPTPRIEGGKPEVLVAKPSEALKKITAGLVERADAIRGGGVPPEKDNMLAVTNDGRRAALDVRLIDPSLPADPNGKLVLVANRMFEIWKQGMQQRWVQLLFSDLGVPGGSGFSVYEEMKRLLVERGVPEAEIAFAQDYDSDAAKAKLQKLLREGVVRFCFGSTQKLGTGWNVQKRLKAAISLDCPWRPSDLEQRDGRADRQGNECDSIILGRAITEGSFDAYSWNLIDIKGRFIEQVMSSDKGLRRIEDVSMTTLSYAEIKAIASGNPLVMEKATVDVEVQKLSAQFTQWEDQRWQMGQRKGALAARVARIEQIMPSVEQDAKLAAALPAVPLFEPICSVAKAAAAGHAVEVAIGAGLKAMTATQLTGALGKVGGFELFVERNYQGWHLMLKAPVSGLMATVERPHMNDQAGVGESAIRAIRSIAGDPAQLRIEHARKCEEIATIDGLLSKDFPNRAELAKARARQAEIEAQLDLDKDTAGTATAAADAE